MASEATKIAVRSSMHMETRVIGATEYDFEIRSDLGGHMEAAMASEAIIMAVPGNMHIDAIVIEVALITS